MHKVTKNILVTTLLVAASVLAFQHFSKSDSLISLPNENAIGAAPATETSPARIIPIPTEITQSAPTTPTENTVEPLTPVLVESNPSSPNPEPTPSNIAREALSFVGINAAAEKVWYDVISNTDTPAKVRKNLIEDLDTDGFQNRRNPTAVDLVLIQNRLAIIEKYTPTVTDSVNSAAFQEAKKDLTKMLKRATTPIQ
jgi:hypothetical protein